MTADKSLVENCHNYTLLLILYFNLFFFDCKYYLVPSDAKKNASLAIYDWEAIVIQLLTR